jgi:uncharacterized protein YdhG (YjbR/CyaY superfamily)
MTSDAKTVSEYLKTVPKERQAALKKIRKLARESLKGYRESMEYGGPCYSKNGVVEAGFFSQKHFIGLYILKKDVLDKHRHEFKGISVGKGAIRYSSPDKIDFELVKKLLDETYESDAEICD